MERGWTWDSGLAWFGWALQGTEPESQGLARIEVGHGEAWLGLARHGTRRGTARRGQVRSGAVRLGKAWSLARWG